MASYNPGDIFIDAVTINSPRTSGVNLARNFLQADVTETIFTPGCIAQIKVVDMDNYLGQLKITGDESVTFTIRKPNGGTANYQMHLNRVIEGEILASMKAKTYTLDCISREVLHGQTKQVQKAYNKPIHSIVEDIFGMLGSSLPINTKPTKGNRNIKIPNKPLFHAIEDLRKQAVSQNSLSSNYMFWQTHSGFNFMSIEDMFSGGDVKTFKQENTVGHSMFSDVDTNILAWNLKQSMDAINRIHAGALKQRVATFDTHTNTFKWKDIVPDLSKFNNLGKGLLITSAFINLFSQGNSNRTVFRYVNHNKDLNIDPTHVPDTIPHKMANLAQMQEQLLHMTVIGDTVLEAGKTIYNNIPEVTSVSGNMNPDPQAHGRWLISKVQHEIRSAEVRPRWVSHLECLKGAYEDSV